MALHCYHQTFAPFVIPADVAHLIYGKDFNVELGRGVLLAGLTHLALGGKRNEMFYDSTVPVGLEHLGIDNESDFNEPFG